MHHVFVLLKTNLLHVQNMYYRYVHMNGGMLQDRIRNVGT